MADSQVDPLFGGVAAATHATTPRVQARIGLRRIELPAAFYELLDRVHEFFDTLPRAEDSDDTMGALDQRT